MNTIGILSSIKNENEQYIIEWIDYHTALGIDHFYIFDESRDYSLKFLQNRYKPHVFVYHKPYTNCIDNYNDFLTNVKNNNISDYWLTMIDPNQYISLYEHDNVKNFLNYISLNKGSLVVNTKSFGSNGHKEKVNKPVVERFTKCAMTINNYVKSIFVLSNIEPNKTNKKFVENKDVVNLKYPFTQRDQWNNIVYGNKISQHHNNKKKENIQYSILINVYETKSEEEWKTFVNNDSTNQFSYNYINFIDKHANKVNDFNVSNFYKKNIKVETNIPVNEIGLQTTIDTESKEIQVEPTCNDFSIQTDHVLSRNKSCQTDVEIAHSILTNKSAQTDVEIAHSILTNKSAQTDVEIAHSILTNKSAQTDDHWTHHIIDLLKEIITTNPVQIDETKTGINAIMILNMTKNLSYTERSFLLQQMGISEKEFQKSMNTLSHIPQEHVNSMIEKYKTKYNK